MGHILLPRSWCQVRVSFDAAPQNETWLQIPHNLYGLVFKEAVFWSDAVWDIRRCFNHRSPVRSASLLQLEASKKSGMITMFDKSISCRFLLTFSLYSISVNSPDSLWVSSEIITLSDWWWSTALQNSESQLGFFWPVSTITSSFLTQTRKLDLSAPWLELSGFGGKGSKPLGAAAHGQWAPLTLPPTEISLPFLLSSKDLSDPILLLCVREQMWWDTKASKKAIEGV